MDDRTLEDLSAYVDGELDPDAHARVAELLASSPEARALLDDLTAGRELARAATLPRPSAEEARLIDAAVLAPTPAVAEKRAATQPAPARPRRSSPRRRGRPPWPYFVAAASFALVLSLGIAVLAQVLGRGTTREAATPTSAATTAAPTPATEESAPNPPAALRRPAASLDSSAGAPPETAAAPAPQHAAPALYLSGVQVDDAIGLAALARGTTAPVESREDAGAALVGLAEASGADLADLASCLAAAGPGVAVRVDVGSFGAQPAYLIVLRSPDVAGATVTAVARGTCAVLATTPAAP